MSWKATFDDGVNCYKRGDLEGALAHMNQAAELQSSAFIIYDSRAAVHEKLGNLKAALLDSKRVIELAPDRWQGYVRSARLFDLLGKYDTTVKMVDHALSRLRPEDAQRHAQMLELREKAVVAQVAVERQRQSQFAQSSYLLGKLPVETLLEIFSLLIDEDDTWAVKLSHVCGHWRHILINTPSAWQTLVLAKKHPLRKAKLWKQRAKNRINRISFDISRADAESVFAELTDLSWDDLSSLRMLHRDFIQLHDMLSDISIPHMCCNLDDLTLFACVSDDLLSCCLSGPSWNLRTLRLTGTIYMRDEWWQRIQQLRELYLSGLILRSSSQVFAANPLLEKFVFFSDEPTHIGHHPVNDTAPTSMDNLRCIELRGFTFPSPTTLAITAPSITHFSMSTVATMADEILLHFATRPSLVELHISNCGLSSAALLAVLSSAPNLETLQISSVHTVINEVFQFLTPKTISSPHDLPCRALKHVDVSRCSDLTTSSVYAFVKTRVQYASESVRLGVGCAIIVTLNVDGCPNVEVDMLPWFRSKVARFSCVYATRKDFKKERRRPQV